MRRNLWTGLLGLALLGCGGPPEALRLGFVNQTRHSNADLWVLWKAAQDACNVRYAAAYSFCNRDLTRYAASWEDQGASFSYVLEYEFENQIRAALGYSLRWG